MDTKTKKRQAVLDLHFPNKQQPPYLPLPKGVWPFLKQHKLGVNEIALLLAIEEHASSAHRVPHLSDARLIQETGIPKAHLSRYRKNLVEKGFIGVKRDGASAYYLLNGLHEKWAAFDLTKFMANAPLEGDDTSEQLAAPRNALAAVALERHRPLFVSKVYEFMDRPDQFKLSDDQIIAKALELVPVDAAYTYEQIEGCYALAVAEAFERERAREATEDAEPSTGPAVQPALVPQEEPRQEVRTDPSAVGQRSETVRDPSTDAAFLQDAAASHAREVLRRGDEHAKRMGLDYRDD